MMESTETGGPFGLRLSEGLGSNAQAEPWQGGMTNAQLAEAWRKKLPRVTPTDADLTAFALGVEVGFSHARDLAAKARKLEAENKRLRKALEPMTRGTFWLSGTDVRRAYKALGKECPLSVKLAEHRA